jgi:hypothetical protein
MLTQIHYQQMKNILLLLALCAGTCTVMAQNTTITPLGSTPSIKLMQPLKMDSSLYKLPPTLSTDNIFKQQPKDLKNLILDKNQKTLFIAEESYKMPVAKLDGYSKMPVVVLDGNSKMPVAGKDKPVSPVTP